MGCSLDNQLNNMNKIDHIEKSIKNAIEENSKLDSKCLGISGWTSKKK